MRAEHPVFYDEQTHFWQVFRYNDVQRVLTDYEHFSSEAVPGFSDDTFLRDTVVAKDPPDHRKLRNLVNLAFTPRSVNHLSEGIAQITHELLRDVLPQGTMDVVSALAFPLPAKVIAIMLGIPHDLRHTTATLLLMMGTHPKIVQELLGHSRISMTLDLYSHVIPSLQEEAMQRFSSYLAPQ